GRPARPARRPRRARGDRRPRPARRRPRLPAGHRRRGHLRDLPEGRHRAHARHLLVAAVQRRRPRRGDPRLRRGAHLRRRGGLTAPTQIPDPRKAGTEMTDTALTPERIRADVERILGEQPGTVPGGENLLDLGMDSIRLMSLVESWRTAGAQTDFIELAEEPSIDAWTRLLTGG